MKVGLGGFMYVLVILILVTQILTLRFAIVCTLFAAALPQLMAVAGLAPLLPVARYGRLVWPATGLIILAQVAMAFHYLQRYELEQRLTLLSDTDELTGVRNRRYFMPLLEREVERAKRFGQSLSLLMLDIDRFKRINDAYGHPTGDLVIRRLADLCRDAVREIDVIARVGGEEFCVLLPGASIGHAGEVAERIRAMVEATDVENPQALPLGFTVSIGVASLNADDATGYDLFGRADTALYAAKAAGRNCVITHPVNLAST
jgi:diguanylate cyclase (GGDEF)-like protein